MSLTKVTRTVVDSISSLLGINNTTGALTSVVPDLMPSNSALYPFFPCRAFVNFNGTSAVNLTGTYSQSGTLITVTMNNHNLSNGHQVRLSIDSGTASWAADSISPVVTRINSNTFTLTSGASKTTSGTTTAYFRTIRGSGNVNSVSYINTGQYFINFNTAMPDINYVINANYSPDTAGAYHAGSTGLFYNGSGYNTDAPLVNSFRFGTFNVGQATFNPVYVTVSIFR